MDKYAREVEALEYLLNILHSFGNLFEYQHCSINDTAGWNVKSESIKCYELSFYKGKKTQVNSAGRKYILLENSVTLFDIYNGYAVDSASGPYHYITFQFENPSLDSSIFYRLKEVCKVLEFGVRVEDNLVIERFFYEIHREYLMKKPYYKQKISLLLQDLVIYLIRLFYSKSNSIDSKNWHHYSIVNMVLQYIRNHYTELILLDDIANHACYTNRYINNIFKQITGYTIIQYLTEIRVEASKNALVTDNRPITDIALDCGFNSSSYFCRVFKKAEGISPSQYRKNLIHMKS